jgi:dTMP kinase
MFITFEGSEGSGKTSQLPLLARYLIDTGYDVLATREPGGTRIGDQVRQILGDLENTDMHPRTEILLFQAARAQHVEQVIRPHLAAGGVVVCDRYADSTLAYQGYGYQGDLVRLHSLIDFATCGLKPDLTILFDLDVEEGLRRRAKGGEWNRLDTFQADFYQRVRQGYHLMARAEPERWVIVDAAQPPQEVEEAVRQIVIERLQKLKKPGYICQGEGA